MMARRARAFRQVDVFGRTAYRGNPLAVVMDGAGLSTEEMQDFTDWTNLSEATFLLPPTTSDADYRVRIFCPGRELPFAGHPTLGSCHAWLEDGGVPNAAGASDVVVQECGVGLVRLRREAGLLAFQAPKLQRSGPLSDEDLSCAIEALGVAEEQVRAHAWCDNGPGWRGLMLESAELVLSLKPRLERIAGWDLGIVGPWTDEGWAARSGQEAPCQFEVRAFFTGSAGMIEDPVTGSLNAALAQWLIGAGLAPSSYVASQGTCLGRQGRVHAVADAAGEVWIGGSTYTCIHGSVAL